MNATELNMLLCQQAEAVVRYLLPGCKIRNGEACVGDLSGAEGDSLKIKLTGAKTGYWADFAGNQKGKTLIGLWCEIRNGDFKLAARQAQDWLGVVDRTKDVFYGKNEPSRPVPVTTKALPVKPKSAVLAYLCDKRGISERTVTLYRIGQGDTGNEIHFPSYDETCQHMQMGKFMVPKSALNDRKIWTEGTSKVLFGKHAVDAIGEDLFITEGEIDALSMADMGYPAVSVPFGAKWDSEDGKNPNDEWIQNDFDWLEKFSRIYLCFDADEPGQRAAKSIVKRLGIERTFLVKMPEGCKDANDVLLKGMGADLNEQIEGAQTQDPAELKNAEAFREDVWRRFNPPNELAKGIPFMLEVPWRIRPAELTIWTGISGHGKSEVLNHAMVHLASLGQKSCIASFEVQPAKTLQNMTMQAGGVSAFGSSSRKHYDKVYDWVRSYVWVVDRVGRFSWKDLLVIFRYARRRYGITQFVVDSLLRCGIAGDDYEGQKAFVDALVIFAMENDAHVHLVAHSRKLEDEKQAPGKLDVKGSGDITDLAHNVASIHRNKAKEAEMEEARLTGRGAGLELLQKPDGFMAMTKQRETGEEFRSRFFFLRGVKQFTNGYEIPAKAYVPMIDQVITHFDETT